MCQHGFVIILEPLIIRGWIICYRNRILSVYQQGNIVGPKIVITAVNRKLERKCLCCSWQRVASVIINLFIDQLQGRRIVWIIQNNRLPSGNIFITRNLDDRINGSPHQPRE